MSEYDMVDRLEKQIEGSNLALAAVAEVLQKMDSRLTKAEEEEEFEMAQDEEDAGGAKKNRDHQPGLEQLRDRKHRRPDAGRGRWPRLYPIARNA